MEVVSGGGGGRERIRGKVGAFYRPSIENELYHGD